MAPHCKRTYLYPRLYPEASRTTRVLPSEGVDRHTARRFCGNPTEGALSADARLPAPARGAGYDVVSASGCPVRGFKWSDRLWSSMDTTLVYGLMALGTLLGHAAVAYYVAPRVVLKHIRAETVAWKAYIAEMMGEAIKTVDLGAAIAKAPVVKWVEDLAASEKAGPLVNEAFDRIAETLEPVLKDWLKASMGGVKGADKTNDRKVMAELVHALLDRFGLMPVIEGLGLGEAVEKNPEGVLRLALRFAGPQINAMLAGHIQAAAAQPVVDETLVP